MTMDAALYGVMAVAVAILGLSKGGLSGLGILSTPLVALVVGPTRAAALLLPILVVQDWVAVALFWRHRDTRLLLRLIPAGAVGVLLSYLLASATPAWGIQIALGVLSLAFSLRELHLHFRATQTRQVAQSAPGSLAVACGVASGFTSAIAHAGTPPFQFYAVRRELPRDIYLGTSTLFFASLNLMKIPAFIGLGALRFAQLETSLLFLPLAVACSYAGARLVRRLDQQRFQSAVNAVLSVVGLVLIAEGILARTRSISH